jgi:hypothetical protein
MLLKLLIINTFVVISLFANDQNGICLTWQEGDSKSLLDCKASSLNSCKGKLKEIKKDQTAFQDYKGKLFFSEELSQINEFVSGVAKDCDKILIQSARDSEGTMNSQWGKIVYSSQLVKGNTAYIYGKSVNMREKDSADSKRITTIEDRTKVKILEKSKEEVSVKSIPFKAYWFKIESDGKTGWVFGAYVHPDPNSKSPFIQ